MFTPSKMLINYLNAQPRDMFDIVGAIMGYINADPQFKTNDFEQAIQYVLKSGISESELFAEFDENIEYEADESKWSEEYYSYARVYLKDNFSKERIDHVKAIAKKLYPGVASSKKVNRQQSKNIHNNQLPVKWVIFVVVVVLLAVIVIKLKK